jgi:hypothetical protein
LVSDNRRLLELALQGLEGEKKQLELEIIDIQKRLARTSSRLAPISTTQSAGRRRRLSAAGRKKISAAMKRRWAHARKQMG